MSWATRCKCGMVEMRPRSGRFTCPWCGLASEAYECGAPLKQLGVPAVHTYKPRMVQGKLATSRRQEDRIKANKGLITVTDREARDSCPPADTKRFPKRGRGC